MVGRWERWGQLWKYRDGGGGGKVPCLRNDNVVEWSVAFAEAGETDLYDHRGRIAVFCRSCGSKVEGLDGVEDFDRAEARLRKVVDVHLLSTTSPCGNIELINPLQQVSNEAMIVDTCSNVDSAPCPNRIHRTRLFLNPPYASRYG